MFTIEMLRVGHRENATLPTQVETLDIAINFLRQFVVDGALAASNWKEHAHGYAIDVYDWHECWSADAQPMARIVAPAGFAPSAAARERGAHKCKPGP